MDDSSFNMSGVLNADLVIANVSDAAGMSDLIERGTGVGVSVEVKESRNGSLPDPLHRDVLFVIRIGVPYSACGLPADELLNSQNMKNGLWANGKTRRIK